MSFAIALEGVDTPRIICLTWFMYQLNDFLPESEFGLICKNGFAMFLFITVWKPPIFIEISSNLNRTVTQKRTAKSWVSINILHIILIHLLNEVKE